MSENPFIGNWLYRSLKNTRDKIEQVDDILLWEAQLVLQDDGPGLVKGELSAGEYKLAVRGAVNSKGQVDTLNMRAIGIDGSPTEGWVYDYSAHLAHAWPEGDRQIPAIVGTVTRTVPHAPHRPAGASYSFVAINQTIPPKTYELPVPVVEHFADRMHRLQHAVWHGIRENWDSLSLDEQKALKDLDWQIEGGRVALLAPGQRTRPAINNGSGEDFLFFHRQMVLHYRMMMKDLGITPLEWAEIPQPGAGGPESPDTVPPVWTIPQAPSLERRFAALKTDEYYWGRMRWWDAQFKDPSYLATLSLGQFGALLQYSIHNDMHMRWSSIARDPETNAVLPIGRPDEDISEKWDSPRYDWLGEFYSSHVNPVFWRLHGWIDDRIEDWVTAHEETKPGSIKRRELGGVEWFVPGEWVMVDYPWVWPRSLGGLEHGHMDDDQELRKKRIESMQKVMKILFPPPEEPLLLPKGVMVGKHPRLRSSVIGLT